MLTGDHCISARSRSGLSGTRLGLVFFLLASLLALASCANRNNVPLYQGELPAPDTTTLTQVSDLRIAPLDELEIKVFGVPELEGVYQVDNEGVLKLPLVGAVTAKGYTSFELAAILEEQLTADFLQEADVTVRVMESTGQQITLQGALSKPGLYPLPGQITLMQAVALGGGLSEEANAERVVIFRNIEGERHAAGFNLREIQRGRMEDPTVYGNDIIVVDGDNLKSGYREALRSVPLLALFLVL